MNENAFPEKTAQTALENFQEQKFGMFIHWGLYAIPAGIWKGEYVRGIGEWIQFWKKIPVSEYEKLAEEFNPVKFNAEEWSELAEVAGMKYMVITAKHHDGFALFDSEASDYNIVDRTPFNRDPLKELAEANRKRDIGFGFYYSQAQDWHEPAAAGNTWDFPVRRDPQPYLEQKAFPQVEELLENYGELELMWFDTPQLLSEEQAALLVEMVKEKQPQCLVNDRIGFSLGDYYQMDDNGIPTLVYDWKAWEVPATLNDTWGYKKNDNNWKEARDLIYKLTDIVRKGGNYLLNVGPTAEGLIPVESIRILKTIGDWLDVNGEAIYGTGHTPFFNTGITWKCTTKPGQLFFHIMHWPGNKLEIPGLESKVTSAYLLKNGDSIPYEQNSNLLTFELPETAPDDFNTVIVARISEESPSVTEGMRYNDPQEKFILHARDARLHGEEARYERKSYSASGFWTAEHPKNELWWYHYPYESDDFRISIEYSCPDEDSGSIFYLQKENRSDLSTNQECSGHIMGTGGEFKVFEIGEMHFREGDQQILKFGLKRDQSARMRVRKIILERI